MQRSGHERGRFSNTRAFPTESESDLVHFETTQKKKANRKRVGGGTSMC